jgi:glutathione S-transferase
LSRSVYTRIARLALEEKGVGYALQEVEIFSATGVPPEHFDRHPFGRIPTFTHGEFSLYETGAITRYIDEAFPGPPLQPVEPRARGRMAQVISVLDAYAYQPMIWGVFVQRIAIPHKGGTPNESIVAESLPLIRTCLETLEVLLGERRFFAGDELTLADLHAAPMLSYFSLTREGAEILASHERLGRWLAEMRARPSVKRTTSVYE